MKPTHTHAILASLMATISAAKAPITTARRIESVDLLRGLVMVLMTLDHTRDFFSNATNIDTTDPTKSWPALFVAHWITHLCAPTFIFLAGAGAYFQLDRKKSKATVSRFLLTRGVWLVFLELTVISFAVVFNLLPAALTLWAIGWSMVALAALIWLPVPAILALSVAVIAGHNLFDPVQAASMGAGANIWKVLHEPGWLVAFGQPVIFEGYPLVPWFAVMALGYCAGARLVRHPHSRRREATLAGTAMLAVFFLLREFHGYGDPHVWRHLATTQRTVMSLFQLQKLPPSLQFLLATLGLSLLVWVVFDWLAEQGRMPALRKFFDVYGRVPFFYFVVHLYLIHVLAIFGTVLAHLNWRWWISRPPEGGIYAGQLPGWGFSLPVVYAVAISVVLILYAPCVWYGRVKARRKFWWLSYL